eukprot:4631737-Prymnesium_polylepis.2
MFWEPRGLIPKWTAPLPRGSGRVETARRRRALRVEKRDCNLVYTLRGHLSAFFNRMSIDKHPAHGTRGVSPHR